MLTDVSGVRVGHADRRGDGWLTGVTVVVPPAGTVGAVDVRGGGPGTHETDALAPGTLVDHVDAVALCGGSAYGLAAAQGVQRWCEEHGRGFGVGVADDGAVQVVPIVPAAAIFDLGRGGDFSARPDAEMGYAATLHARSGEFERGAVGAGTGARTAAGTQPGGVGTATIELRGGVVVAALVVLNAAGRVLAKGETSAAALVAATQNAGHGPLNTTLAVIATNASLDVAAARRMAGAGHDGLARAISPVHTLMDGDTVFALATGDVECVVADPTPTSQGWPGADQVRGLAAVQVRGLAAVQAAAADAVQAAVLDAWQQATTPSTR